jgi:ribonuclease D
VKQPRLVEDQRALGEVVDALSALPAGGAYALDTEFHRERTYWPRLALIQVAWDEDVVLVDPLAVDVASLADVLQCPAVLVAHAADQDLEVLELACGVLPTHLFDTQIAAGFLGLASPSLASLAEKLLGLHLLKGDRLTDWSRRPLTSDQQSYAAADVAHLLELADVLRARLSELGRLEWAEQECVAVLARPRGNQDPDTAWWRLRDSRSLRGASRGVAQSVAGWRERRARATDVPPRFVLSDLALLAIAHKPPRDLQALSEVRGIDGRNARGRAGEELLAAVQEGTQLDGDKVRIPKADEVDRHLRPAVALAAAWVSQLGREASIDPALLATRADLVALLRGDEDCRLATGWRAELVGDPVRRLVDGQAALAFDGHGGLVLEARSFRPFEIEPVED